MTKPIIFLDIDGVLNSERSVRKFRTCRTLCPNAISELNHIIKETDCEIVISSTWRFGRTTEELEGILLEAGADVKGRVVGKTPDLSNRQDSGLWASRERGHEIHAWMVESGGGRKFAIIDDDSDMAHLMDRFVKTSNVVGLSRDTANQVIRLIC